MSVDRRRSLDVSLAINPNDPLPVDTAGELTQEGANGSENTPLGIGATYTSDSFDCSTYSTIRGSVLTDQVGFVFVEYSWDSGSTWIGESARQSTVAGDPSGFISYVVGPLCRVNFTNNSGIAQGSFSIGFGGMKV